MNLETMDGRSKHLQIRTQETKRRRKEIRICLQCAESAAYISFLSFCVCISVLSACVRSISFVCQYFLTFMASYFLTAFYMQRFRKHNLRRDWNIHWNRGNRWNIMTPFWSNIRFHASKGPTRERQREFTMTMKKFSREMSQK